MVFNHILQTRPPNTHKLPFSTLEVLQLTRLDRATISAPGKLLDIPVCDVTFIPPSRRCPPRKPLSFMGSVLWWAGIELAFTPVKVNVIYCLCVLNTLPTIHDHHLQQRSAEGTLSILPPSVSERQNKRIKDFLKPNIGEAGESDQTDN